MEFLLGIDKNFIGNLMENIIEGRQEGEVEDPIKIIVDMITRMARDLVLECVNTTETMFVPVVRIHMNRITENLQFKIVSGNPNRTLIYILISLPRSILIHYSISF